jgi:diacylglycerol kinase family enzyme
LDQHAIDHADHAFGVKRECSAAILVNARSGLTGRSLPVIELLTQALSHRAIYPRVFMAAPGHMEEALEACRKEEPELLFVIGGDGTILAAAEAFLGTKTALAIIPGGTVNQLARDLGIPLDPAAAVSALGAGALRAIDVGMINGRAFLCTSVTGPLAKLQRYREEARGSLWATLGSFVMTGFKATTLRPAKLSIRAGAAAWQEETRGVIVSVNPLAEVVSRVPLRERLDGGRLAVYAARESGYLTLFRMAAAILAGRARHHPNIAYHECAELTLDAKRRFITVLNDGEIRRLRTPLNLAVRPGALTVVAPLPAVAVAA